MQCSLLTLTTLLLAAVSLAAAEPGDDALAVGLAERPELLVRTADVLAGQFDAMLTDDGYAELVADECDAFDHGPMLALALPAWAYANRAVDEPEARENAIERIAALIETATPQVVAQTDPRGGDLTKLADCPDRGATLGLYNLMLCSYRLAGGDNRFDARREAVSAALRKALTAADGAPICSAPGQIETVYTIACLLSLHLADPAGAKPLATAHFKWIDERGTDADTALPYSAISADGDVEPTAPRGSDLSLRIALLANLDAARAHRQYARYEDDFWLNRDIVIGFAEWPEGRDGPTGLQTGGVFMGVGMRATRLGIATAAAMGQADRAELLCAQMSELTGKLRQFIAYDPGEEDQLTLGGRVDAYSDYLTGYLMGDAELFYAATWRRWRAGEGPSLGAP